MIDYFYTYIYIYTHCVHNNRPARSEQGRPEAVTGHKWHADILVNNNANNTPLWQQYSSLEIAPVNRVFRGRFTTKYRVHTPPQLYPAAVPPATLGFENNSTKLGCRVPRRIRPTGAEVHLKDAGSCAQKMKV